jgi:hypothetical protein
MLVNKICEILDKVIFPSPLGKNCLGEHPAATAGGLYRKAGEARDLGIFYG